MTNLMPKDYLKVDPDVITESGHALLGPSGAERWLSCTPSARLGESVHDESSVFAEEGTAAHAAAEARLAWLLSDGGSKAKLEYQTRVKQIRRDYATHIEGWTNVDWEAIDAYVDYVLAEIKRIADLDGGVGRGETVVGLERLVDYSMFVPAGSGTADAIIWNPVVGVLKVIDLKFGKGVAVDARGNPQARLYALGALCGLPDVRKRVGVQIEWAIVQPRLDYIGEDSTTIEELLTWAEHYVKPRAAAAWRGEGELNPSEAACRWCKVAPTCRARFEKMSELALAEFMTPEGDKMKDEMALTPTEIGDLLPKIDDWISWAQSVKARALSMARDEGIPIPGHKLVRGRTSRAWGAAESVILGTLREDFDDEDLLEPAKLKSVAQVEKAVGKVKFGEVVAEFVVTKPGHPTLVPESDKREAISLSGEALASFGDLDAGGEA